MSLECNNTLQLTPIQNLGDFCGNQLWIKREDMIPFCFGGNKVRKAKGFFRKIDADGYDVVVTYGSGSSNHCRVIANMAVQRGIPCCIISPEEAAKETFNTAMMRLFGAEIVACPVQRVAATIDKTLADLRARGKKPYFIPGGGHGNIGTQAYVDCYEEIRRYEREQGVKFDYVFLASGTGTTQAGLVCGQIINQDNRKIVGISIARRNPRGRDVVIESIRDYLQAQDLDFGEDKIQTLTIFLDDYIGEGYGAESVQVGETVKTALIKYGVPLDATYTGKAFWGMTEYLKENAINDMNILFVHTGGTPLFFDCFSRESM